MIHSRRPHTLFSRLAQQLAEGGQLVAEGGLLHVAEGGLALCGGLGVPQIFSIWDLIHGRARIELPGAPAQARIFSSSSSMAAASMVRHTVVPLDEVGNYLQ